jgi:hypothetical protein
MKIKTLKNLIRAFVLSLIAVVAVIAVIKVKTIHPEVHSLFVMLVFVMIAAIVDFFLKEYLIEKVILQFIKANETRIVQKGWENLICWHRYKLSDSSEELLVTLAKVSEKHRKILLNYGGVLCLPAAERFVKELFDYLEEFLFNNRYQPNILSILVNNSKAEKKYVNLLERYVEKDSWGYVYLSHFVKELIENKQVELLVGYCREEKCMYPADEISLVKQASIDPAFRYVLEEYLKAIKNAKFRYWRTENSQGCSEKGHLIQNNLRKEAEEELVSNGSYDTIKLYCKYVENLYSKSIFLLAKRYQHDQEDEEIKNIILRQKFFIDDEKLVLKDVLGIFRSLE